MLCHNVLVRFVIDVQRFDFMEMSIVLFVFQHRSSVLVVIDIDKK